VTTGEGSGSGTARFPGSSGTSGASPETAAPRPVVVPATGPLTIGVTYIENSGTSAALGVDDPSTVSKKNIIRALIAGINAGGGVDGRKLKAVEYEWNSQSNDWSADAAAACARFTQDNHVAVVLDNAFGTIGGFRDCLQRAGVASIQSSPEGDEVSSSQARLHANVFGMTVERTYGAVLTGLTGSGYLTARNQVGVIIEACPGNSRAWTRTLKPLMARLGLKAPQEATVSCTNAFADAGPAASAVSNDVLRFGRTGVDRVMFVSDNESVLLLVFSTTAESQRYRPGYLLSSAAQAQAMQSQVPAKQLPGFHGAGYLPFGDVDGAVPSAVDKECIRLSKAGGVSPAGYADYSLVLFECGPFLLLKRAVHDAGGAGTPAALTAAIAALGTGFAAPGVVGSATRYDARRHDGPELARVFGHVASCNCLRFSGAAFHVS
jgi:hypothetical protein